jgi:SAM-dependent methyltransferase
MGNEMSKANSRRFLDWRYRCRWFVGTGLDIGCGYDPLKVGGGNNFTKLDQVVGYDLVLGNKDAQTLPEVADNTYDFIVSSHCLEHMVNPNVALQNWLRVVKPGGFLTITVPEWDMYEHRQWPSKFNGDHKWSWSLKGEFKDIRPDNVMYVPMWLLEMNDDLGYTFDIEMLQVLTEHYQEDLGERVDQTGGPAECAIEFVLRKT